MPFIPYFDSPANYNCPNEFYSIGGSPYLLEKLLQYFEENRDCIAEVFVGFYLFNNSFLNEKLESLAESGIQVHVVTIPIEGYDKENAQPIVNMETFEIESLSTKYDLARKIFARHYLKKAPNFHLYFFPHQYIRSSKIKTFSRGSLPYSLHIKSILVKYKNRVGDVFLSSSNFAVRDLIKEENMLLINEEAIHFETAEKFFKAIINNSILISAYDFKASYSDYKINFAGNSKTEGAGFIAPFYFESPFAAEASIKNIIDAAKESIVVVGQHICPINYTLDGKSHSRLAGKDECRAGFLDNIIARAKTGVKVGFLSQTFASGDIVFDYAFRKPSNKNAFTGFYNSIKGIGNISYAVNENIHSKYIIADNQVFVSSFNYTPTQFVYLDNVSIENFDHNPGKVFKGVYCETGHYCIENNAELSAKYRENYNGILKRKETKVVKQ